MTCASLVRVDYSIYMTLCTCNGSMHSASREVTLVLVIPWQYFDSETHQLAAAEVFVLSTQTSTILSARYVQIFE